jgi:hypothetical protein
MGGIRLSAATHNLWRSSMGKNTTEDTGGDAPKQQPQLDTPEVKKAIQAGKKVTAEGGTKADAARAMYELIAGQEKATIVNAFVEGAGLTEKGALTYWYNCRRKASKKDSTRS